MEGRTVPVVYVQVDVEDFGEGVPEGEDGEGGVVDVAEARGGVHHRVVPASAPVHAHGHLPPHQLLQSSTGSLCAQRLMKCSNQRKVSFGR